MRNFQLIGTFDPVPLLNQINRNPQLWNQNLLRTTHENTPHKDVDDIWVRFNDVELYKENQAQVLDEHESIWYPATHDLPAVRDIVFSLMHKVSGVRLGRVIITRVAPGKEITPHADSGSHASYFERYHCVLQSLPGSLFQCGNEKVNMLTGTIWWFQNIIEHSVINNSADDRIHLIVDIKC